MKDLTVAQYNTILYTLVGICLFFTIARLAVRTWKHQWAFWLSEVWLIIGLLMFITTAVLSTYALATGLAFVGDKSSVVNDKIQFAVILLADLIYYFPRFSLLAFYNELFPISEEQLRKALYLVMIYNACGFIVAFFVDFFWCGVPISVSWDTVQDHCAIFETNMLVKINWPIGIVAEIIVFILPFGMLRTLKVMPRGEKISLICLFSIGIVNIILSVCRFAFAMHSIYTFSSTIVTCAEITSQYIVCAVPALRPLLPFITTGWTRISSIISNRTVTVMSDDERTLHGSYSSRGGKGMNSQANHENVAELGEWQPEESNSEKKK